MTVSHDFTGFQPTRSVMLIVPGSDELMVEVRVAPQDIDQLTIGQKAVLRFAAFNQRTTPEIGGCSGSSPRISRWTKRPAPLSTLAGSASRATRWRD